MRFPTAVTAGLLATGVTAFDKYQPWGKRDYSCINVYQGIPENATVTAGQEIELRWNREPTTHCTNPLAEYPASNYSIWLWNNPQRVPNSIHDDAQVKVVNNIPASANKVSIQIPTDLPKVKDESVWYLRLDTTLATAPQMPSIFSAAGPFTITTEKA
ncbi:hypothetical protein N7539_002906 [Penicillium diatomitis]|uniref:Yeast cell wall synthesis Kre9/Knh1-like N-terminal domain-containing protein n=1 Tax=Penicillium diatomitis TaxID=2819901 RepID=A0A9X0BZB1_9EURO|nr:uncharacterized protein N7539_002906 [Penicillium diatomitis]KAJ5491339.1 hypothetical protein N7539_002906 [Penicillium diatomitis]